MNQETLCGAFPNGILQQPGFTAEKMRNPRDIEKQAVGRIERHQRRVAHAPIGNRLQQFAIRRFVCTNNREIRHHGAGIGQRLARIKPELCRGHIDRCQLQDVATFPRNDKRTLIQPAGDLPAALQPIDR